MAEHLSFYITDFKISSYGILSFTTKKSSRYNLFRTKNKMSDETFADTFHTRVKRDYAGEIEEVYVLDTDLNKGRITKIILEHFPSSEITEVNLSKKDDYLTIKELKVTVNNFSDF